jgi:predicted RNA-binding Zn-ribbon protein involved in translation (DUF1610 family)
MESSMATPSTSIVTCECGTRVRLPEDRSARSFRCPACKQGIALTIDAKVLSAVHLQAGDAGAVCQICQTGIGPDEPCVTCPQCGQVHHRECWSEIGGCGTYGCAQAPAHDKSGLAQQPITAAWGDTKRCPACGEEIKSIALRCRYCGTDFESVDPMNVHDLRRQAKRGDRLDKLKQTTTALFVGSLIGCLAPLMLILCLTMLMPRRSELQKLGPLFQVLAYAALILSSIFSALMLFFFVIEMASQ